MERIASATTSAVKGITLFCAQEKTTGVAIVESVFAIPPGAEVLVSAQPDK